MEQFADRHEIMEIGIPPGGIVHPAFPFVVLDSLKLPDEREMDPVIHATKPLIRKYASLQPSTKSIDPIERRSEDI